MNCIHHWPGHRYNLVSDGYNSITVKGVSFTEGKPVANESTSVNVISMSVSAWLSEDHSIVKSSVPLISLALEEPYKKIGWQKQDYKIDCLKEPNATISHALFCGLFFPPSCLILGNRAKFFWILCTWFPFPCPSKNSSDIVVSLKCMQVHWLHWRLKLVQTVIWISLHLIFCWLHIPVLSATFLVHYTLVHACCMQEHW